MRKLFVVCLMVLALGMLCVSCGVGDTELLLPGEEQEAEE
jgi:hypothetical protein